MPFFEPSHQKRLQTITKKLGGLNFGKEKKGPFSKHMPLNVSTNESRVEATFFLINRKGIGSSADCYHKAKPIIYEK